MKKTYVKILKHNNGKANPNKDESGINMLDDSFRMRYKSVPAAISEQNDFSSTKLHNHKEFEILLINSGSCTIRIANNEYFALAGDMVFINPMEVHGVTVNSDKPYSHQCICFDLSLIMNSRMSDDLKNGSIGITHIIKRSTVHNARLKDLFQNIFSEFEYESQTFAMEIAAYLTLMFSCLIRNSFTYVNYETPKEKGFCGDVMEYINGHYTEKVTSKKIADAFYLNHSYFCRKFKENFGVSFSAYLNRYRMSVARALLEENSENITEISYMCGFDTPTYFSKCFKKHFGVLPSEYKK